MGGTKGSHFITAHPGWPPALAGRAIYAEARDGRPVFILPWAGQTLVGTTDETYSGDPGQAVASRQELDYLLDAVRHVFPQFPLSTADVTLSYAGVRPLPHSDAANARRAITREHFFKRHPDTSAAALFDRRRQVDDLPLAGRADGRARCWPIWGVHSWADSRERVDSRRRSLAPARSRGQSTAATKSPAKSACRCRRSKRPGNWAAPRPQRFSARRRARPRLCPRTRNPRGPGPLGIRQRMGDPLG